MSPFSRLINYVIMNLCNWSGTIAQLVVYLTAEPGHGHISFLDIGCEIISTAILALPLIQDRQLSFTVESMCRGTGPSCWKLMMLLVNVSLKFTSSDTKICWNFLLKKMWVAFAVQKLLTFFQQKISEYCILNLLKQLTKWPLTSSLS